jgi:hypothetical protein
MAGGATTTSTAESSLAALMVFTRALVLESNPSTWVREGGRRGGWAVTHFEVLHRQCIRIDSLDRERGSLPRQRRTFLPLLKMWAAETGRLGGAETDNGNL